MARCRRPKTHERMGNSGSGGGINCCLTSIVALFEIVALAAALIAILGTFWPLTDSYSQ
jgi:hypothetical protein